MSISDAFSLFANHQVTKKITLKMKCEKCSALKMKNLGRCKHFELGAEKKKKGPMVHGR